MRYIFSGGGTGGHIFPAIAIADEIKKIDAEAEILFVGAKGRIEEIIVPQNNYKLVTIEISGFERKKMYKNVFLPVKIMRSITQSKNIIREFRPDVAVGTGGFVCGPVIHSAIRLGVPALIQEGNAYAGRTIKILSGRSDKVVINFDETRKYLRRKNNIIKISHPVRSSLEIKDRAESLIKFGLDPGYKTVFIFGGSQGARGINNAVINVLPAIVEKNLNVIWQTGVHDYENIISKFAEYNKKVKILKFIINMDEAYSAADLIICRAGITSIMEIALLKKAAILVPLPGSAEDHQISNAMSLKKLQAAEMILQEKLNIDLLPEIIRLTGSDEAAEELRNRVSEFSDKDAAKKIAEEVISLGKIKSGIN